jgi:hypothetical protein
MTKIQKRHTEDKRFYCIREEDKDPMFIPSVTTIIHGVSANHFLQNFKEEQAEKMGVLGSKLQLFLDADRGTNVHSAIEQYNLRHIQKEDTPLGWNIYTDQEWKCINRYHQWFHIRKPRVLSTEYNVYSKEHWFAGQLDSVMEITPPKAKKSDPDREAGVYIVDFKTSKDIYEDAHEQVAAYAFAYEEITGKKVDGALVLALRVSTKKGWKERYFDRAELEENFKGFLLRKAYFNWKNPDFQPKRDLFPEEILPLTSPSDEMEELTIS